MDHPDPDELKHIHLIGPLVHRNTAMLKVIDLTAHVRSLELGFRSENRGYGIAHTITTPDRL
jgi:hypothetical protein